MLKPKVIKTSAGVQQKMEELRQKRPLNRSPTIKLPPPSSTSHSSTSTTSSTSAHVPAAAAHVPAGPAGAAAHVPAATAAVVTAPIINKKMYSELIKDKLKIIKSYLDNGTLNEDKFTTNINLLLPGTIDKKIRKYLITANFKISPTDEEKAILDDIKDDATYKDYKNLDTLIKKINKEILK